MTRRARRELDTELAKHFWGTPGERMLASLRLGGEALDLFRASLPRRPTRARARAIMQRNKHRGRQRSAVIESLAR